MIINNFVSLIIGFIICRILFFLFLPTLKKSFLDLPIKRSSHLTATPRGGGICFVIVGSIAGLLNQNFLFLIPIPLAIIGFIDDKKPVKQIYRFFVQVLTSLFLVVNSELITNLNQFNLFIYLLFIIFLTLIGTSLINFINFMDGIDGLVTGCVLLSFFALALSSEISLYLFIGSLLSFLILNWTPSKIFMGDVGSTYLGALLFGFAINLSTFNNSFMFILISFPLLYDSSLCLLRRFLKKKKIFSPHKSHLYQRLNQSGWSHPKVSSFYIFYSVILAICYYLVNIQALLITLILFVINSIYLEKKVALKFK